MGLDGVELVMAVEEEFRISIDDRDAEQIQTVGQLWDYICERVSFVPTQVCATAASFYRLRRAFMANGVSRSLFHCDSAINAMLPETNRRAAWSRLGQAAGIKLPALELSPLLEHIVVGLTLCLPMGAAVGFAMKDHVLAAVVTLFGGVLLTARLLEVLVRPWRTRLNPAWATAGGLAQTVVGLNPKVWNVPATQSREIAWERLRAIIVESLGVSADLVRPEASFVNDLGMD